MRSGIAKVCILGLATAAQADFAVLASSNASVTDAIEGSLPVEHQIRSADHFPDAAIPMSAASSSGIEGREGAQGDATTRFATLHAHSSAGARVDGSASGEGLSEVDDTLHVESSTLANGTPVSLLVEFGLYVGYSPPAVFGNPSEASVHAKFFASPTRKGGGLHLDYIYDASSPGVTGASPPLSGTMAAQVGDVIPLNYYTSTHIQVAGASASATLNGSVRISVDGATPDVTLIADSGYDYTQTVPEPSAAASLGAALVGLICLGRKRAC